MTATLMITPHSADESRLELVCPHGSTLAFFGSGNLKLSDSDLGRLLGNSHRATFGCDCHRSLEIRRPVGAN